MRVRRIDEADRQSGAIDVGGRERACRRRVFVGGQAAVTGGWCVVDRSDGDREGLRGTRVSTAAGNAAVVVQADGNRGGAVRVRGGRVGQRAVGGDRRGDAEETGAVVAHHEIDGLRRFAGWPGADAGRPSGDGLSTRVFKHGHISSGEEAGSHVRGQARQRAAAEIGLEFDFAFEKVIKPVTAAGDRRAEHDWD